MHDMKSGNGTQQADYSHTIQYHTDEAAEIFERYGMLDGKNAGFFSPSLDSWQAAQGQLQVELLELYSGDMSEDVLARAIRTAEYLNSPDYVRYCAERNHSPVSKEAPTQ